MSNYRLAFCCLLAAASCAGDAIVVPDDSAASPSGSRLANAADCPTYSGVPGLARACMFDSNGKTYAEDGTMYVFPADPPYGARFVFEADAIPAAADVATGPGAAIGVFAAPYDVASPTQCCAEDSEANRIPADATIDASGVLVISVANAVPVGYQIAIILDFGKLYRSRIAPANGGACDLPSAELCAEMASTGFAMRFYVGALPGSAVPKGTDAGPVADGACLLSYNTALVAEGADDCCYRKGGPNTCNTTIKCNERSGGGCCLIYGTENTTDGGRCCLYAGGGHVDGAEECAQLLAAGR